MDIKVVLILMIIGGFVGFLYVDLGFFSNPYIKNPTGLFIFLGIVVGLLVSLVYNLIISYIK